MTLFVKIPKNRVGALIGTDGAVKRFLEERTGVTINIDSKTGDVAIEPKPDTEPIMGLKCRDIVQAIARGFSPERAYDLLDEDAYMELFDIREYAGKDQKHVRRVRARLIGSKGKTRRLIEELAEVKVSIMGNTVGIIGPITNLGVGAQAVHMLLSGSEHATVYRFLERKRREMKMAELGMVEYR